MLAGLLIAAAAAADPTGARPGAGAPELTWAPVLDLRAGIDAEGDTAANVPVVASTRARVGVELARKVLTARVTVAGEVWGPGSPGSPAPAVGAGLGEAWVRGALPLSSAIGLDVTAGVQPVDVDGGVILGDDDERLDGRFPLAGRLHIRALPWDVDWVSAAYPASADPADTRGERPFHALRVAAGRDNPVWAWHVGGLALLVDPGGVSTPPDHAVDTTFGLHGDTSLARVRLRADGYVQPTDDGPAWCGGGDLGYALGDDDRVELAGRLDVLSGGAAPTFLRPFADTRARFGWVGLFDADGPHARGGALDAAFVTTAIIAPQLRFSGAAHHFWTGDGTPLGPELDADLRWYWSPLATVHLRGGAFLPWSTPDAVRIDTAATIDVHF